MKKAHFKFMGAFWSMPAKDFERFQADIERLGHVPDPAEYGAVELKSRPKGYDIPKIEPAKDDTFWSSRT